MTFNYVIMCLLEVTGIRRSTKIIRYAGKSICYHVREITADVLINAVRNPGILALLTNTDKLIFFNWVRGHTGVDRN